MVQTYAFLDPGSTGTFCSEKLMQRLNLNGRRTQVLLRTMGQTNLSPAFSLCDLEVAALEGAQYHPLPDVFTQMEMPVTKQDMVTSEDLVKWQYLSKINLTSINAEVDLLIGTNAPKLLEPWEVNRISVSKLEVMLVNQYNQDFSEQHTERQEMSQED